jgi:anti-anti-sigma regulatory factor
MASRAFKVTEIESWPECLELLIEGEVDRFVAAEFEETPARAIESDHHYLLVDLDRCELIDIVAAKLLVVAHAHLSVQGTELLIFGAPDRVRGAIEAVGAFDGRVLR